MPSQAAIPQRRTAGWSVDSDGTLTRGSWCQSKRGHYSFRVDGRRMKRPDEPGRQVQQHRSPRTAMKLQEDTTMATEESALTPESPKLTDLLFQLREASTPEAQRDVMVKSILAGRNNEISV